MVIKIDKKVKDQAKKISKKYKELRKKDSKTPVIDILGISISSLLISDLKGKPGPSEIQELSKDFPQDLIKKGSLDKIADFLKKTVESNPASSTNLSQFLQNYLKDPNSNESQIIHALIQENKDLLKDIVGNVDQLTSSFPLLYHSLIAIASNYGYSPKQVEIMEPPPINIQSKLVEEKKSIEIKTPIPKQPKHEIQPEIEIPKLNDDLNEIQSNLNQNEELESNDLVQTIPESISEKSIAIDEQPLLLENLTTEIISNLNLFLNIFNPEMQDDFQKREMEDIIPFIEYLEISSEGKTLLQEYLNEILNLIKNVISATSMFSNFFVYFIDAQYIGDFLRIRDMPEILNYDLTHEDKSHLREYLMKYRFSEFNENECLSIWENSPYEDREQWAKKFIQFEPIRKQIQEFIQEINNIYDFVKILDYWNTLKDYSEIPELTQWIRNSTTF